LKAGKIRQGGLGWIDLNDEFVRIDLGYFWQIA
jgi:hypothetical protein